MESVEERLKRIIECVKCPETGSEHFGEWGILTREQRLFLNNLARDTIDLLDCMDKKIRETQYKIEQGTLIELHCKIGDIVYETEGVRIYEHKIDRIIYVDKMLIYDTNEIMFDERAIGVSIFLTREEAEKRLLELQGETKL